MREVAAAVGLAEGEAGVRDVALAVARLEPVPTRALSRATGLPVPIVAAVCGELRRRGVLGWERPSRLSARGRELFGAGGEPRDCGCPGCGGHGLALPAQLDAARRELERIAAEAPPARTELDQTHCTVDTKVRRVLALHQAGALAGRSLLLLGDDDLASLAIPRVAAALALGGPRSVTVVDVDPAVLAFVRRRLGRPGFPVDLVEHDLRAPLPARLIGAFDTVFADPPYTLAGAELFLARAAEAVVSGGSVFLAFPPKRPAEALRLQQTLVALGFATRSLRRGFNAYRAAGILGGVSDLHQLVAVAPTSAEPDGARLYTGEARPPRPYRCASCRSVQPVG
ncbi:MAG TPA: bis-aminopropyl spermidine synthase family protein, partial [Gaiellaceae bacterium]|nr:bis-aminopropyl spermidine synthase family protein [Gaiellaceae bacterium]